MKNNAKFVGSFPDVKLCPKVQKPEYAFIGRSNVGKSTLINFLAGKKDLALVSQRPGKTQMINYFLVDETWFLVDLPGYGYAKVSKTMRAKFSTLIDNYLLKRETLQCAFVLIDSSIPPQKIDLEFINWLGENGLPFVIVHTKMDKAKVLEVEKNIDDFKKAMLETWNELPNMFRTSAVKKQGAEQIMAFIAEVNKSFDPNE